MNKFFLVIIIVLLCLIGYKQLEINELYEEQEKIIYEKESAYDEAIDKWIQDKQITVREWSKNPLFKNVFNGELNKSFVLAEILDIQKVYTYFKYISIVDANGNIIVSSSEDFVGENIKHKEYFQTAIKGIEPESQSIDYGGSKLVNITMPVFLGKTTPVGIMFVVIQV